MEILQELKKAKEKREERKEERQIKMEARAVRLAMFESAGQNGQMTQLVKSRWPPAWSGQS